MFSITFKILLMLVFLMLMFLMLMFLMLKFLMFLMLRFLIFNVYLFITGALSFLSVSLSDRFIHSSYSISRVMELLMATKKTNKPLHNCLQCHYLSQHITWSTPNQIANKFMTKFVNTISHEILIVKSYTSVNYVKR